MPSREEGGVGCFEAGVSIMLTDGGAREDGKDGGKEGGGGRTKARLVEEPFVEEDDDGGKEDPVPMRRSIVSNC